MNIASASIGSAQVADGRLKGKRALVTGGGRGIGRGIVELFLAHGAAVAAMDLDEAALGTLAAQTPAEQTLVPVIGDVTKAASAEAAVQKAVDALGGLDIVVNNVGLSTRGSVETTSEADWDRVSLNTKSAFLISKYAVPHLRAAGGGSIVNIGSGTAIRGSSNRVAYGTAKAGIVMLSKLMALDHAGDGIRVNCLCPGLTETDLSRANRIREAEKEGTSLEAVTQRLTKNYPLGRLGRPIDIAYGVLYLSSDEASWVTGATLVVDGGRCAGAD